VTRIVAGAAGGRRLAVPPGERTRPTSDRAREGLFSALAASTELGGARVLDLYAGSGALGLEALSRGAAEVLLIESDARAVATLRENVRALGLPGATVRHGRVEAILREAVGEPYGIVLADPPYELDIGPVLDLLVAGGWAADVVVVERASRDPDLIWPSGLRGWRSRRYGAATLWYGRAS